MSANKNASADAQPWDNSNTTLLELRQKGLQVAKELVPEWDAEADLKAPKSFGDEMVTMSLEQAFGGLWTREALDRRSRSLVTVTSLIASKNYPQLGFHIPAAIRNGVKIEELEEIIYQASS